MVTPLRAQLSELHVKRGTLTEELDTHRTQMKALMEVGYTHACTLNTVLFLSTKTQTKSVRRLPFFTDGNYMKTKL